MIKTTFLHLFVIACLILLTSSLSAQGVQREIEWSAYPLPIPEAYKERVKFGYITVPETRNSENPRTIRIAFCVLKGTSETGMRNPIIRLPGGPGGGMVGAAPYLFPSPNYIERFKFADVVLVDPRGCGLSEPELCPQMNEPEERYNLFLGQSQKASQQGTLKLLKNCLDSLTMAKVDLNAYGSDEVAEDVEDLRVSLGVEKWNLMGGSYGTRYGQAVIRKFPQHVKSAVFGGLVPTIREFNDRSLRSFSRSLQLTLNKCLDDEDCAKTYPNLENDLFDALNHYNENPLVIPANEQKLVKNKEVIVSGDLIAQGLFALLYSKMGIEIVPKLIQSVAQRKDWVIINFVNSMGDIFKGLDIDMSFYISANDNPEHKTKFIASDYDAFTRKLLPYFYDASLMSELEMAVINGIKLDTTQEVPIPSNIPVILYTGELDPVTPPDNAIITSGYLTNSVVLTFPGNGHGLVTPPCFSEMITHLFKTGELPDQIEDCISQTEPLHFAVDVAYNKGISQVGSKILMGKENQVYIPLGISLLLVLIGFFGFPIKSLIGFINRKRNSRAPMSRINWMPWIMNLFVLAFFGLLYLALMATMEVNGYILGFGLLASWNWIFWILLVTILMLVYVLSNRRRFFNHAMSKSLSAISIISVSGTILVLVLMLFWNILWPFSG